MRDENIRRGGRGMTAGSGGITRRGFLGAAVLGAVSASLEACCPCPKVPPTGTYTGRIVYIGGRKVYVRRRLSSWTAQDYASYRQAVQVMQARPVTDPTSWLFQAYIHGAPPSAGNNPAWRQCPHGSIHFLSWHRMYLYWWERILRKASGDPDMSIGYWRYEDTDPQSLSLPQPFLDQTAGNPLFMAGRTMNGGQSMPASAVVSSTALAEPELLSPPSPGFSASIESSPHNNVHVQVGGLMGSVPTAAQDPIFWTHHANIDRFWKRWLDDASHANPSSGAFLTTNFQFFDENGATVSMTGAQVLDTINQLDYKYDDDVVESARAPRVAMAMTAPSSNMLASAAAPRFELGGEARTFEIPLEPTSHAAVQQTLAATDKRIVLRLEDVSANGPPEVSYEVYVNLPPSVTPNYKNPHFVGTFSLFGLEHNHSGQPVVLTFNLSATLRKLSGSGLLDPSKMRITLVPVKAGVKPGERIATTTISSFGKMNLLQE